jgi:hypothetical protein
MKPSFLQAVLSLLVLVSAPVVRAIVFSSTGDSSYNTTAPTGALEGSGWQYVGNWNGFVGTQISQNQFITAAHVGGSVGGTFTASNGQTFTTLAVAQTNDLAIWTVSGALPAHAPIYRGSSEGSLDMVVFGRGIGRGAEVRSPTATDADNLRGWEWGGSGALRWGTNRFEFADSGYVNGSTQIGSILAAGFSRDGGADEATVASGDSGGATFVRVGSEWQLAGIVYGVQSSFRTTPSGSTINAAIFDMGALYGSNGSLVAEDATGDIQALFIASRLGAADNQAWILSQVPEPAHYALVSAAVLGCGAWFRRRARR